MILYGFIQVNQLTRGLPELAQIRVAQNPAANNTDSKFYLNKTKEKRRLLMTKKICSFVLALVLVLLPLTGCGKSADRKTDNNISEQYYYDEENVVSEENQDSQQDNQFDASNEDTPAEETSANEEEKQADGQAQADEASGNKLTVVRLSDTKMLFGSYPNSRIKPTQEIIDAEYDSNGDAVINGFKYRRVSRNDATLCA